MDLESDIAKVKDLLAGARDILVVTHERPTFDSIGSSLALALGLEGIGKKVTVACPDEMTVALSNFVGVNKVIRDFGKKNFVISLDYAEGSIDKVSYNIDGDKFNLVIEPRSGFPPFSADKVHYTYEAAKADLIFVVDTIHLGGVRELYEANKELFAGKQVVNIDRHPNNNRFGSINLLSTQSASSAELVAYVLAYLGIKLTADIATNLLNALYAATDNFQSPQVTAPAFELAGTCLRAGGKRFTASTPPAQPEPVKSPNLVKPPVEEKKQIQQVETSPAAPPPDDWLKPKIFKSSNLL